MIRIENLTKTYAGNSVPSVNRLSLEINDGEIFGFIGPNGAGKSTTIKCMTGIIGFDEGSITVDGYSLREDPIGAKRRIGYVSDDHAMYEGLTGREYVNFMCDVFGVPALERNARLERLLEVFSLTEHINNQIGSYSHGMKQKLNIIGAVIHEPKVWILDEPMTGLDPKSAYALKQLMREHADKGNIVFFSSHVLEVVEKVCDRIGIIDGGQLVTTCTIAELKQRNRDDSLEQLFLKLTEGSDFFAEEAHEGERANSAASDRESAGQTLEKPENIHISDVNASSENEDESKLADGAADNAASHGISENTTSSETDSSSAAPAKERSGFVERDFFADDKEGK